MQNANLSLVRGDDQPIGVTVQNSDGTAYNLTGCSLTMDVRRTDYFSDMIPPFPIVVTGHVDPTQGLSQIFVSSGYTANMDSTPYYYDIRLLSAASLVTTLQYGQLYILPR